MARFGEVDEVAALISWIAPEECSFTTAPSSTFLAATPPIEGGAQDAGDYKSA
jgi:hypothetical protein